MDPRIEADKTLRRLEDRLAAGLGREGYALDGDHAAAWEIFQRRLHKRWPEFFALLFELYGGRYDLYYFLERILFTMARAALDREPALREHDLVHEHDPAWHLSQRMAGGALYVDLFSENLCRMREQVGYFKDLGLSYVHLMPLFAVRPGDNDGGYAISNYRSVDPRLGTVEDLRTLARELREAGISLVLDFVFNHTADDHDWARKAQEGDPEFRDYYYIFPDRHMPDQYEHHLREIFPTVKRGNFTWHEGMQSWVWTTFNTFQWDLKYANPAVFDAMLEEMLFIANTGVDILRLDAVAFIWKRMGTSCENLPEAHTLIRAFNAAVRITAPSLLFKSEAIVHPDDVVKYIAPDECQLSYNPTLMALCWESLATREVKLLRQSLSHRHRLPEYCTWINYLRCHDDIGWTFDDADAGAVGISAYDHRQFLNAFYTGQFEGSFARGVPFQHNEQTGDMRIAGTLASLAGLEQALERQDPHLIEMALRRMNLLNSIIMTVGGIPLLYLGEEWGLLNDYEFVKDPAKAGDSRWIHRPKMRWEFLDDLGDHPEIRRRLFRSIKQMISLRKESPALYGMDMELIQVPNPHVLGYLRKHEGHRLIVLANFCDTHVTLAGNRIRMVGLGRVFNDLLTGREFATGDTIELEPYQSVWLQRA